MQTVACLIGTRPEAIKMAPVIHALREAEGVRPVVVSTGQHREMLDQVVELFGLEINADLAVMKPNQTLAELTARLLRGVDGALAEHEPVMLLVQGDTTTVLAGALAAFYRGVPVGHVEAGLRTGDLASPFPEEANRVLTSRLAALHFAPTAAAKQRLLDEGVDSARIFVTGNTVIDALLHEVAQQEKPEIAAETNQALIDAVGPDIATRPQVLITGHRRENFGHGFEQVCHAIARLAERFADHLFIYPAHLNPNVQEPVHRLLGGRENIRLIPPQPYRLFVALMSRCRVILTDSGGVQEEAPGLGKPVLVTRSATERPEGVASGTVRLLGTDADRIVREVGELLDNPKAYAGMAEAINPYGDGNAAPRIARAVQDYLGIDPAGA